MATHLLLKMMLTPQGIGHRQHFAEAVGAAVTLLGVDGVQTAMKNSQPFT